MGLNIKNAEAEAEIRGLAAELGVGLTEAVTTAAKAMRARNAEERQTEGAAWMARILALLEDVDAAPDLDVRSGHEIIANLYGEDGLPA